jgi:hypothetical protein
MGDEGESHVNKISDFGSAREMGALFDFPETDSPVRRLTPDDVRRFQKQRIDEEREHRRRERELAKQIVGREVTDEEAAICRFVHVQLANPGDETYLDFEIDGRIRCGQFETPTTKSVDEVAIFMKTFLEPFLVSMDRNTIRISWGES